MLSFCVRGPPFPITLHILSDGLISAPKQHRFLQRGVPWAAQFPWAWICVLSTHVCKLFFSETQLHLHLPIKRKGLKISIPVRMTHVATHSPLSLVGDNFHTGGSGFWEPRRSCR